jgi:hypothetical protein
MDLRTEETATAPDQQEAPAPSQRASRLNDWASYNPSTSTSRFSMPLELGTGIGQRSFGQWYARVQTASVMLVDVMPRALHSKQQAQDVMDVVTGSYDQAHEELQDELLNLRQMLREKGIVAQKCFTKPRKLNVPFYNNYCLRFLQMVAMFEDVVWHLDCLATYGVIKNSERMNRQSKARGRLNQVSLETVRVWSRAKQAIRRTAAEDGHENADGVELAERKVADLTQSIASEAGIEIDSGAEDDIAEVPMSEASVAG